MKNITLALDDETYRRARIRAAERDTSVSAMVKELLVKAASEEPQGLPQFLELAAQLRALSAGRAHTPAETLQREGRDER